MLQALVHDKRVEALHMTGSTATYNAIVWSNPSGPDGAPQVVTKPFEAELGCGRSKHTAFVAAVTFFPTKSGKDMTRETH